MKLRLSIAIGLLFAGIAAAAGNQAVFQFVPSDGELPPIVVSRTASLSERFAAEELASHLATMTGRQFPIIDDVSAPGGPYIAVGQSALTSGYDPADLGVEQYVIDAAPGHLIIMGGKRPPVGKRVQDRGTLYGVYDVLERLGVRWYRPEPWGMYVPHTPTPQLPAGNQTSKRPDYEMRAAIGCGYQRFRPVSKQQEEQLQLWAVRNRLNWNEAGGGRYGGQVQFTFEHSYYLYIPPKTYFAVHPEYFALVDPNDGGGWCQCPRCRAMDDPDNPRIMSNRIATFNNMIARRLAAEAPGVRVHWLAYSEGTIAPTIVKRLEPNAIVQLSTINEWGDYTKALLDPSSVFNRNFVEQLTKWDQVKPSAIMTYEYWSGGYGWPGPLPIVHAVADRLRNYRQFNVTGVYSEAWPHWGPQGMDLYFIARLMCNPDLDLDAELDLYYRNYYGPAAAPMKAYHETLRKAFDASASPVCSGGRGMQYIFTPRLVEELGRCIDQARSVARGQDPYQRRIEGVWAGYEFARRISQVLATKKKEGKIIVVNDGRSSYYASDKAAQQYEDAVKFVLSFYEGDAVFDINLKPPDYGGLYYLKRDVLENDALPILREEELLKDF